MSLGGDMRRLNRPHRARVGGYSDGRLAVFKYSHVSSIGVSLEASLRFTATVLPYIHRNRSPGALRRYLKVDIGVNLAVEVQ